MLMVPAIAAMANNATTSKATLRREGLPGKASTASTSANGAPDAGRRISCQDSRSSGKTLWQAKFDPNKMYGTRSTASATGPDTRRYHGLGGSAIDVSRSNAMFG